MVQKPVKGKWYNAKTKGRYIPVKVTGFGFDNRDLVFIQTSNNQHYSCKRNQLFEVITLL